MKNLRESVLIEEQQADYGEDDAYRLQAEGFKLWVGWRIKANINELDEQEWSALSGPMYL